MVSSYYPSSPDTLGRQPSKEIYTHNWSVTKFFCLVRSWRMKKSLGVSCPVWRSSVRFHHDTGHEGSELERYCCNRQKYKVVYWHYYAGSVYRANIPKRRLCVKPSAYCNEIHSAPTTKIAWYKKRIFLTSLWLITSCYRPSYRASLLVSWFIVESALVVALSDCLSAYLNKGNGGTTE